MNFELLPYHIRTDDNAPWQQYYSWRSPATGVVGDFIVLKSQHLTDSSSTGYCFPSFKYKFTNPPDITAFEDTVLLDQVKNKLYTFHIENSNFTIRETTVEIKESFGFHSQWAPSIQDINARNMTRYIQSIKHFLGHFGFTPCVEGNKVGWFLNAFDGSIFQITSFIYGVPLQNLEATTSHTISWLKLDDGIQVDAPYSDIPYDGKVKMVYKYKLEFPQYNCLDWTECGILFNKDGRKMLMRFGVPNPDWINERLYDEGTERVSVIKESLVTQSFLTHQMSKPPTYALFALNYDTHTIQLLTQFVPSSVQNHSDLLISTKLLSEYEKGFFSRSLAQSFLSQRSRMIGQYQKYTFFYTVNKGVIAIVAIKSLMRTLQYGHFSLTPKKLQFLLEDDRVKMAFENLTDKNIKWDMLAPKKKNNNSILVVGNELILQIYPKGAPINKAMEHLATIRIKLLADEYKDYRKCAGCGKIEEHKRRSKNGKRISQFKVCGWCKDHNLHKVLEIPCHYCSEECADSHWPIHQLEHNVKEKGMKTKGKKAKGKKKKGKK